MKTFYFNTGVRPYIHNPPVPIINGRVVRGGVMLIPFKCDGVPDGAKLMFMCDDPNLPESKCENVVVAKIEPGSEFGDGGVAYFRCPETDVSEAS
jgi:hypothetical protein